MYLRQFFMALVVETSLGCAAASEAIRPAANTCTVLQCGTSGLPGRDGRDQGTDAFQKKLDALENKFQTFQAEFNDYINVVGLTVGQKTFISTHESDTFTNGRDKCKKAGGTLACPKNIAENAVVHKLTKRDSKSAFLDITDIQMENIFVYADGMPVGYTNWKKDEPNNRDKMEHCVTILSENGEWNDFNCNGTFLIICEF